MPMRTVVLIAEVEEQNLDGRSWDDPSVVKAALEMVRSGGCAHIFDDRPGLAAVIEENLTRAGGRPVEVDLDDGE